MPFFAENLGRWWGKNPVLKKQEEINLLATDDENAVICECKYTEDPFDEKKLKDLQDPALCVTQQNKSYIIFSKNSVSSGVERHLKNLSGYSVVTLDHFFLSE